MRLESKHFGIVALVLFTIFVTSLLTAYFGIYPHLTGTVALVMFLGLCFNLVGWVFYIDFRDNSPLL